MCEIYFSWLFHIIKKRDKYNPSQKKNYYILLICKTKIMFPNLGTRIYYNFHVFNSLTTSIQLEVKLCLERII